MKPRLIPNWKRAWRMFSVQAQAGALAVLGAWQAVPEDLKAAIPAPYVYGLAMALLVLGIVGRLVDQPKVKEPSDE
jgi:hypothetical protein